MYKVVSAIKTYNWDGLIVENSKGDQFITNGIYKWENRDERKKKYSIVDFKEINVNIVVEKFNQYIGKIYSMPTRI